MSAETTGRTSLDATTQYTVVEAVKELEHRYLRACDAKDAKAFRSCFIDSGASIDFGPLGAFDVADAIVEE
ncbi:hypothetical protein DW322_02960 [Rhodococcus rhodnii]|uniref:SnoaL-like domain-containing protein n=2 Tax=Rhodococcus rhodnii TaxID=38312 RepID=R7WIS8_9NOCA|nr:hypothetical protein Rrhod_3540 [Rhodococcus rhodnii LMG 5362]TXG89388.1 hypothetical protein DW322_02960 [Rhodococcus rhodnii]